MKRLLYILIILGIIWAIQGGLEWFLYGRFRPAPDPRLEADVTVIALWVSVVIIILFAGWWWYYRCQKKHQRRLQEKLKRQWHDKWQKKLTES